MFKWVNGRRSLCGSFVFFFYIDICDLASLFLLESSLFLKSVDCELKTDGSVEIREGL